MPNIPIRIARTTAMIPRFFLISFALSGLLIFEDTKPKAINIPKINNAFITTMIVVDELLGENTSPALDKNLDAVVAAVPCAADILSN